MDQPIIVFTPSTPTMSAIPTDQDIENLPPMYKYQEEAHTSRRKSFCRSFSTPAIQQKPSPGQPVILHRPRSSSPIIAHWSLTRARHALLESCWGSGSNSRAAVAMGMVDSHAVKERRNVSVHETSQRGAGREKGSWHGMDDDDDDSEPETSPSTPVFTRHSGLASTRQSPRCLTLMSTLVIALALAALAFTTFFHPTFGDSISKLPVSSTNVRASFGEEGRLHRFLHFDELFGHSDEDGLVGISTEGSAGELRKRGMLKDQVPTATIPTSHRDSQINHTASPQKRWNPWTANRFGSRNKADDDVVVNHRRALGKAEERLMRRKQAMAQGNMPRRRR
ncbi:hypothetical protein QFC22_004456 [Naganishia vaughanmartiniae]|uniref:Uncharacterized protein n=1 Tax=Naganishia vaughanmartiniae TaxID=1424756 RepID=A0ACC2X1V2_9TREE|nr:hypothetical protein QFC22_004456 [Naganishia vaughanmartiniae]